MAEITDADRQRALALAEQLDGAIGPATALRIMERALANQRAELEAGFDAAYEGLRQGVSTEYRAVLKCTQDPCSYCYGPARRIVLKPSYGPFATSDEAREHGRSMARNVYGGEHRVLIETQTVSGWKPEEA